MKSKKISFFCLMIAWFAMQPGCITIDWDLPCEYITSFQLDGIETEPETDSQILTFSWDEVIEATSYEFQLSADGMLIENQTVTSPFATVILSASAFAPGSIIEASVRSDCNPQWAVLDITNDLCGCPKPEAIGVDSLYLMDDPTGVLAEHIQYKWNKVPQADSYDFMLTVNEGDPIIFQSQLADTTFLAILDVNVNDLLVASVRANCGGACGAAQSDWTAIAAIHKNGGATVDPLPFGSSLQMSCDIQGACDFIHFPDGKIEKCDGSTKLLKLDNMDNVFFDRQTVCDCLNNTANFTNFCDGIANIENCLTTRYLKHDYGFCP